MAAKSDRGQMEARSLILVSHVDGSGPNTCAIFHCFPRYIRERWIRIGAAGVHMESWCHRQKLTYYNTMLVPMSNLIFSVTILVPHFQDEASVFPDRILFQNNPKVFQFFVLSNLNQEILYLTLSYHCLSSLVQWSKIYFTTCFTPVFYTGL